jgi:glycosyltransferase involved in cell wall biosynthesis
VRITHVNTYDCNGGAARAAYRLHDGLRRMGQDSRMFVLDKTSNDSSVTRYEMKRDMLSRVRRTVRKEVIRRALASFRASGAIEMTYFADDRTPYGKDPWPQLPESDVIQLHWVSGFVDYEGFFSALPMGKPLVWTMHAMEAMTGGCYYDNDCGKFAEECGACPQVGSTSESDLTRRVWQRKRKSFGRIAGEQLHIVSPSRWMRDQVKRSSLLSRFPCSVIPNGLDTEVFSPRDRGVAREKFGIPLDAKAILFLADGVHIPRKGFHLLVEALAGTEPDSDMFLISVGPGFPPDLGHIPHRRIETIRDDELLAHVYSAADVLVVPSLQENLPNTALEAIACGTPVLGFAVGGIPDIVRPGVTGLLAAPADAADLRRAIVELLGRGNRNEMARNCRQVALEEYGVETQARRYIEVYEGLLENHAAGSRQGDNQNGPRS